MAATRENEIGRCSCPVCKSTRARLRVSTKQLAYVTCDTCNAQVFARSDRSDEALRALHINDEQAPAQETAKQPAKQPEPVQQDKAPAATPVPAQAAAPVIQKTGMSWGILGGQA